MAQDVKSQLPPDVDINKIPRKHLAGALAMMMVNGMRQAPGLLSEIMRSGRNTFISNGLRTDVYGLSRKDYGFIFDMLEREALQSGFVNLKVQ